ncbi:uncharacterized protein LOC120426968 isoform X2 [Culex pipiens pallens]|uniref:uncharacterized protein LOC120420823 isoform X2 n=1 Tax=Culex pipiens pallens TaxID=42434 RepID=UPI001953640F|nr:uncharacterized protein LOC120420823 isoform X2 [Culex pipiens pallens]XP_039447722.1 uncharacterized protein LOC120426968 isoform X2 [Culex pipiens pallens]
MINSTLTFHIALRLRQKLCTWCFLKRYRSSVDILRKKWKALRDIYRRELQKIPEARSGDAADGDQNYSTWAHFKSMAFVRDQMRPRKMSGNLQSGNSVNQQEPEENEENECAYEEEHLDESAEDTFEVPNPPPAESGSPVGPSPPPKKKRMSKDNNVARLIDIETKKLQLLERKVASKERDEDEAFLESLLPHLRKLDPEQKLLCRMKMQSVVLEHVYSHGNSIDGNNNV